ncbi:MAG TPA: hypothetical protein VIC62_13260 [Nakamurella sp.]|jgi:hypothetical protein
MQVQSTSSQTTVNFSDSTTITAGQTVDLAAVTAGLCISGSAGPTGQGSGVAESAAAASDGAAGFAATTVQLSDPENGQCSTGFGAGSGMTGPGTPPSGGAMPTDGAVPTDGALPSGVPDAGGTGPSGAPPAGGGGLGGRASGTVTSVSGSTIVISETDPSTQTVTETSVTVGDSTTYTKRATATAAALAVGRCAVVQGSTDDKGAVTATSIVVSAPASGSTCSVGMGGGPGGRGRGGAAGTTTAGS